MNRGIKIFLAIFILLSIVMSFAYSLIQILDGIRSLQIINNTYSPSILKVEKFRGGGTFSTSFNEAIGMIKGEEKFLVLTNADWEKGSPKYAEYEPKNYTQVKYYAFYTKGDPLLHPRKKDQLVFDKTPFKKGLYFKFIFPLIINPLLWFLWSRLSKSFK